MCCLICEKCTNVDKLYFCTTWIEYYPKLHLIKLLCKKLSHSEKWAQPLHARHPHAHTIIYPHGFSRICPWIRYMWHRNCQTHINFQHILLLWPAPSWLFYSTKYAGPAGRLMHFVMLVTQHWLYNITFFLQNKTSYKSFSGVSSHRKNTCSHSFWILSVQIYVQHRVRQDVAVACPQHTTCFGIFCDKNPFWHDTCQCIYTAIYKIMFL